MKILLTGSTGFLGKYLVPRLLDEGYEVYALVRDVSRCPSACIPIKGDITKGYLGIDLDEIDNLPIFDEIWHSAGNINLSKKSKARADNLSINTSGTRNICLFALRHRPKRLLYVSTAYARTDARNSYEMSKWWAERLVEEISSGFGFQEPIQTVVFKPSILVGDSQTGIIPKGVKPGAFYDFVRRLVRIHLKVDRTRKKVEERLSLPTFDLKFRLIGDPESTLNLIPVDVAADNMISIAKSKESGTFYISNPTPPKLGDLAEWVGEATNLSIRVETDPVLSSIEKVFSIIASDFLPYLSGDNFISDILACPSVNREFIRRTLSNLDIPSLTH